MSALDDLMTALLVERYNGGGWKKAPALTAAEQRAVTERRILLRAAEAADAGVVVEMGGAA